MQKQGYLFILAVRKKNINREEFRGKNWGKRKKKKKGTKKGKKGRKEGNSSKKEGKYPYFVSLFNIGPYDRKK